MLTALIVALLICLFIVFRYAVKYHQQAQDASMLIRQLTTNEVELILLKAAREAVKARSEFSSRNELFDRYWAGTSTETFNSEPTDLWRLEGEYLRDKAISKFESIRRALSASNHFSAPTGLGTDPLAYLQLETRVK